jgi:hypothetical protein
MLRTINLSLRFTNFHAGKVQSYNSRNILLTETDLAVFYSKLWFCICFLVILCVCRWMRTIHLDQKLPIGVNFIMVRKALICGLLTPFSAVTYFFRQTFWVVLLQAVLSWQQIFGIIPYPNLFAQKINNTHKMLH